MGVGGEQVIRGDIACLVYLLFTFFVENIQKMLLYIPQILSQLRSWLEKCRCSLQNLKTIGKCCKKASDGDAFAMAMG